MIIGKHKKAKKSFLSLGERNRRKRELVISIGIIVAVAVLTLVENRVISFGADIPVSNTILMFILININLLLLILLIFLVFRNLTAIDRRRPAKRRNMSQRQCIFS